MNYAMLDLRSLAIKTFKIHGTSHHQALFTTNDLLAQIHL